MNENENAIDSALKIVNDLTIVIANSIGGQEGIDYRTQFFLEECNYRENGDKNELKQTKEFIEYIASILAHALVELNS